MKNEAKEESGEESADGNLEASTMTTTSLPQAQKLQQPLTTSEPNKNEEQSALVGAATYDMFMSSEKVGEEKDQPQNEVVSMKDKYAGKAPFTICHHLEIFYWFLLTELVAHNSRLVEILQTTLQLQTDLFSRFLSYLSDLN